MFLRFLFCVMLYSFEYQKSHAFIAWLLVEYRGVEPLASTMRM